MRATDKSERTRTLLTKGRVLSNFHRENPSKQIEGPHGTTTASVYTAMENYQAAIAPAEAVNGCLNVKVSDIAAPIQGLPPYWGLKADTTILDCQTLTIPSGITLFINNFTFTNNGTITIQGNGFLRGDTESFGYPSLITNNGVINILPTGGIPIVGGLNDAFFINNGVITNNGDIISQTGGTITNNGIINNNNNALLMLNIATVNNNGTINHSNGSLISNGNNGIFINTGRLNNNGTFSNRLDAERGGEVFNSNGGIFNNVGGTFTGESTFYNADGTEDCGKGIIYQNQLGGHFIVVTGNYCP
jgi:hypothetical protein